MVRIINIDTKTRTIRVSNGKDDLEWFTTDTGSHVPLKKGQSKSEAIKEHFGDKKTKQKPAKQEPKQSSQPTSYDLDDAFDEADLWSEWNRVKHRLDFHGVSQDTIRDIIDSGMYEAGDIIEALESNRHDKIDEMKKMADKTVGEKRREAQWEKQFGPLDEKKYQEQKAKKTAKEEKRLRSLWEKKDKAGLEVEHAKKRGGDVAKAKEKYFKAETEWVKAREKAKQRPAKQEPYSDPFHKEAEQKRNAAKDAWLKAKPQVDTKKLRAGDPETFEKYMDWRWQATTLSDGYDEMMKDFGGRDEFNKAAQAYEKLKK